MRVMQHMLKRILHRLNMSILPRFVDIYPPNILQQLKHSHSWTPAWQPASGYKLQSQKKQKHYKSIINRILNRLHSQPQLAFSHPCFLRVVRLQTWEYSVDSSCASENPQAPDPKSNARTYQLRNQWKHSLQMRQISPHRLPREWVGQSVSIYFLLKFNEHELYIYTVGLKKINIIITRNAIRFNQSDRGLMIINIVLHRQADWRVSFKSWVPCLLSAIIECQSSTLVKNLTHTADSNNAFLYNELQICCQLV